MTENPQPYSETDPTERFISQCKAKTADRKEEREINKAVIEKGADAPQRNQNISSGDPA